MKVDNTVNFSEISTTNSNKSSEKEKEVFQKVFIEKLVREMLKTATYEQKEQNLQNDLIQDQMVESLSDQLMSSSALQCEKLLNLASDDKAHK